MKKMNTADFDFRTQGDCPNALEKRDSSEAQIVNRETGEFQDKHFHSIIDMLESGDALVMNDTVFSCPPLWSKEEAGGRVGFSYSKIPKWR